MSYHSLRPYRFLDQSWTPSTAGREPDEWSVSCPCVLRNQMINMRLTTSHAPGMSEPTYEVSGYTPTSNSTPRPQTSGYVHTGFLQMSLRLQFAEGLTSANLMSRLVKPLCLLIHQRQLTQRPSQAPQTPWGHGDMTAMAYVGPKCCGSKS